MTTTKLSDAQLMDRIESAISHGLHSRQDIAMSVGLSVPRFNRIAAAMLADGRIKRLPERDRFNGVQFDLPALAEAG
jgi:hypothetical protein